MGADEPNGRETTPPVEVYTPERKAEFLLQSAIGREDYERACAEVRELGVDPASIPHDRPV